ncbi:unnamed protein product [Cylindrotheca closterium]|uniref:Uncharacterized protein n=1 Tax=Cylindrotheca closterium TaxID=2856 RepID=A0AAD2CAY6_9STRA|nr:unnamed protein product [Cylindrotheca closterium]
MVKVFRFDNNPKRERRKRDSPSNASFDGIIQAIRRMNSNDNDNSSSEGEACVTPSPCSSSNDDDASCTSRLDEENEPVNAVIVAASGHSKSRNLPDSFQHWARAVQALVASKEMEILLDCSRNVAFSVASTGRDAAVSTGSFAVHVVKLPVTVPLHIATTATSMVCDATGNVLGMAFGSTTSSGESSSSQSPIDALVHGIVHFVPFVSNQAGKITQEIGGVIGGAVGGLLFGQGQDSSSNERSTRTSSRGGCGTPSGESSAERRSVLDRLSLEIQIPSNSTDDHPVVTPADFSKFLLRVDDVDVWLPQSKKSKEKRQKAQYIDLETEFCNLELIADALGKMKMKAIEMSAVSIDGQSSSKDSSIVEWKPEGKTGRYLEQMAQLSEQEFYKELQHHVLFWCGTSRGGQNFYGSDVPLFLARGVVRRSPLEFINLLWNSDRTSEYNDYNLGRSDALIVTDNITCGGSDGTKVVKSKTKVPFTRMALTLSTVMHASKLDSEEGYVVISRSLNTGSAGHHACGASKNIQPNSKSEVLMGVNIMRPVPGNPNLTDLTSLSQVSSSMVPQFLAARIGIMGIQDFFNNVR